MIINKLETIPGISAYSIYYFLKVEKGYNATSQIVGYLISGDLGYISSYKNARNIMSNIDRGQVVEYLLNNYLKWDI